MIRNNFLLKKESKHKLLNEINVTPLVDVMLVLLIIFMVTAPMLVTGLNVDLPEDGAKPVSIKEEPLTVSIDVRGKIYILDNEVAAKDLIVKLNHLTKSKLDSRIFVRGDKNIPYGQVIKVVSDISEAGFNKVALITQVKQNDK